VPTLEKIKFFKLFYEIDTVENQSLIWLTYTHKSNTEKFTKVNKRNWQDTKNNRALWKDVMQYCMR
jgi:hypothetical protein